MKNYVIDPLKNGGKVFTVRGISHENAAGMAAGELFGDSTLMVERVNGRQFTNGAFKAKCGEPFYVELESFFSDLLRKQKSPDELDNAVLEDI